MPSASSLRRHTALLLLAGLTMSGLSACSSSASTSASSSTAGPTTTSVDDPDLLEVISEASKVVTEKGIDPTTVTLTATASTANDSWMRFVVTPRAGSSAQPLYGFAHQAQNWSVVAMGSSNVGCPGSSTGTYTVPKSVLNSFGLTCPSTTTTSST